jgi:hypothetical protein
MGTLYSKKNGNFTVMGDPEQSEYVGPQHEKHTNAMKIIFQIPRNS